MPPSPQPQDTSVDAEPRNPPDGNPSSRMLSKRIIVCCDGTWQDGIVQKHRWEYSNILKLSRMINHQDDRQSPPIHQIVFYQAGIGSERNIYSEYIEGATGGSLAEKVQEAYGFIAHNYQLGDEIFLFGFSRGAYTARMTAAFIGEIGVLDRVDMDHFADIFIAYQKRGDTSDQEELERCNKTLEPWTSPQAKGRVRADADGDTFTIKCVGVFDTVGSLGMPKELSFSHEMKELFGFHDKVLGAHIQHAFHAMGMHETRADFDVAKYEQTEKGRKKGQVLRQVWFSGCHSDVGGGYQSHDLADVSLAWMASNIESMLSLNLDYLRSIPRPISPWGAQIPHNPKTGMFELSNAVQRSLPTKTDNKTQEYIHHSVTSQHLLLPQLEANISANPELVTSLAPLEERFKNWWPYVPGENQPHDLERERKDEEKSLLRKAEESVGTNEVMEDEGGRPRYEESWMGSVIQKLQSVV
ncbi:hypothetical protein K439DRAFT_1640432 [Ramaria rubella]|nr:hypothetical protein K439DRAFT_1640432 [Ramaria rubella]